MDYGGPEQAVLSRVSGVSGTVTCSRGASKTLAAPGPLLPTAASRSCSCRHRHRFHLEQKRPRSAAYPGVQAPAAAGASRGIHSRPRLPLQEAHVPILGSGASCGFQEGGLRTGRQPGWERGWRWRNRSCQSAGRESGGKRLQLNPSLPGRFLQCQTNGGGAGSFQTLSDSPGRVPRMGRRDGRSAVPALA